MNITRIVSVALMLSALFFPRQAVSSAPGKAVIWKNSSRGPVVFDGTVHMNKGYRCQDCHSKIFSRMNKDKPPTEMKMQDMYDGKLCGACHNGKDAFSVKDKSSCARCHK